MKKTAIGALILTAMAALLAPPAYADQQSEAAAMMQAFGLMAGAIANANRPPVVYVVPQPYPVYVQPYVVSPPVCWWERRWVPTDYGLVPQSVQVCQ